jgi:hypothetical protein
MFVYTDQLLRVWSQYIDQHQGWADYVNPFIRGENHSLWPAAERAMTILKCRFAQATIWGAL